MGQISYRTIIRDSIQHFNAVQDVLSTKGAKYDGSQITLTNVSGATLVPTASLSTIIDEQLQLIPTTTLTLTDAIVSGQPVDVLNHKAVSVPYATFSSSSSIVNNKLNVRVGCTNGGWTLKGTSEKPYIQEIALDNAELGFDGPNVVLSKAGYVHSGVVLPVMNTANVGVTPSVTSTTIETTKVTVNGSSESIIKVVPTSGLTGTEGEDYFILKPYALAEASASVTSAGYLEKDETFSNSLTTKTNLSEYYLERAVLTVTGGSTNVKPTIVNGTTENTGDVKKSGNVSLYGSEADSITPELGDSFSGHYVHIKTEASGSISGTSNITLSKGYSTGESTTGRVDVDLQSSEYYVKLKSGSVIVPDNASYTVETVTGSRAANDPAGQITVTGSYNPSIKVDYVDGYIDSGSIEKELTVSTNANIDLKTIEPNLDASYIKQGVSIFGIVGTLEGTSFLPELDHDAFENHIIKGFKAYNEEGNVLVGTLEDYSGQNITGTIKSYDFSTKVVTNNPNVTGKVSTETNIGTNISSILEAPEIQLTEDIILNGTEVNPSAGKILDTVKILPVGYASVGDVTITAPSVTEVEGVLDNNSNIYNISDYAETDPSNLTSGYVYRVRLGGTLPITATASGWVSEGQTLATAGINKTLNIKIDKAAVLSKYEATSSKHQIVETAGFRDTIYIKEGAFGNPTTSASVTNKTASATASGDYAKINASATSYVKVEATSTANVNMIKTAGWFDANSQGTTISSASASEAKIAASVNPVLTTVNVSVSGSDTIEGVTTYDDRTGTIIAASEKTTTVAVSGSGTQSETSLKDTYVVGNATLNASASGSVTVSLNEDATGSAVDAYVGALLNRMLGVAYTLPNE